MASKRGTAYIAPVAVSVPDGRTVDPKSSRFWVSWQSDDSDDIFDDDEIVGAERAIAWARERADVVFIRLGHRGDTYFSAGAHPELDDEGELIPPWPPTAPPREGWFTPDRDDA